MISKRLEQIMIPSSEAFERELDNSWLKGHGINLLYAGGRFVKVSLNANYSRILNINEKKYIFGFFEFLNNLSDKGFTFFELSKHFSAYENFLRDENHIPAFTEGEDLNLSVVAPLIADVLKRQQGIKLKTALVCTCLKKSVLDAFQIIDQGIGKVEKDFSELVKILDNQKSLGSVCGKCVEQGGSGNRERYLYLDEVFELVNLKNLLNLNTIEFFDSKITGERFNFGKAFHYLSGRHFNGVSVWNSLNLSEKAEYLSLVIQERTNDLTSLKEEKVEGGLRLLDFNQEGMSVSVFVQFSENTPKDAPIREYDSIFSKILEKILEDEFEDQKFSVIFWG